jgi:hypothetical protein
LYISVKLSNANKCFQIYLLVPKFDFIYCIINVEICYFAEELRRLAENTFAELLVPGLQKIAGGRRTNDK